MKHQFNCYPNIQKYAVQEFNDYRPALEAMHQSTTKVVKMYWRFGWKVEYELEKCVK